MRYGFRRETLLGQRQRAAPQLSEKIRDRRAETAGPVAMVATVVSHPAMTRGGGSGPIVVIP